MNIQRRTKLASVKPKKHLGQHFLKDENIARKIVDSLKNTSNEVLEVGPGTGVLTKHLVELPKFKALDVDQESIEFLKQTYPSHQEKFLLQDFLSLGLEDGPYAVIGNFPYNISSQLFFKVWENRNTVEEVVCMIQKEVADRICASSGSKTYGILSVLLQAFYTIEHVSNVSPGVFHPPPKVQSSVIRLERNNVEKLDCDEDLFKRVVKAGFGKRRKTLRNALKDINLPRSLEGLEELGLRAEQLSVSAFVSLTAKISSAWEK